MQDDDPNPNVAVHLVTLYVAVCHRCNWESPHHADWRAADVDADEHVCLVP